MLSIADLTLTKFASSNFATQGQTISYTVTLVNLGPSTALNVTITDILSAGLSLVSGSAVTNGDRAAVTVGQSTSVGTTSLSIGQTLTLVINATVTATSGTVTNTAAGTSTTPDQTPGNNTATVATPVASSADLTLTKVASSNFATQGQTISY
ncbi:MAG: DUF11 domain-containing protein, partial [Polaromonas sp.]|nr:DUF11 domain-containing protein [Polaromonas sp.]